MVDPASGRPPPGAAPEGPLDPADPRFPSSRSAPPPRPPRRLVPGSGPGAGGDDPLVRILRVAVPAVAAAGLAAVGFVFFVGLSPGPQETVVGREAAVRVAVAARPRRVCFHGTNPCAWLTTVNGEIVAYNTNGPLPQEYGREGIGWCPTSGWFGSNATGSRFDQQGRLARGPSPRGLDRFGVRVERDGRVVVDFRQLTAGRRAFEVTETTPPAGPDCDPLPFDRDADLRLDPP